MSRLASQLKDEVDFDPAYLVAPAPAPRPLEPVVVPVDRRFEAHRHQGLASATPIWQAFERDGLLTAYQRLAWAEAIARHLVTAPRCAIVVIEVRESAGGRPVMLFPFVVLRRRLGTVVEWCDLGVCDYAAPVLGPGLTLTAREMAAIWSAVKAELPRADLIRINRIPCRMVGAANPMALLAQIRPSAMHASGVAIDGDPATLMKRLGSPSTLRDLAKARKRLQSAGDVRFVVAKTQAEVEAIFTAIVEQRRQRFAAMGRFDLLSVPDVEAFYLDAARAGLKTGFVQLFGLKVGAEWVASAYGLVHGGAFHGILLAMAGGAWLRSSPGLYIAAQIMTWARGENLGYFDFTIGAMPYKAGLGAQSQDLFDLSEALTWRGAVVEAVLQHAIAAKAWLTRHPALFTRLRAVRRGLRRWTGR